MSRRLDQELVVRGLFESRARARAAIEAGGVMVAGRPARSAAQAVGPEAEISAVAAHPFVSRAALKLVAALDLWPVPVADQVVLDIGASTGGFSEVCLKRGAARVYAVDVGQGQLHPRLRTDPRLVRLEGTDARALDATLIPEAPGLIVTDLSFISLTKALGPALDLAAAGAELVALVKPQFEQDGPGAIGKGGIVTDAGARQAALVRVTAWLEGRGWSVLATTESPVAGGDGNREWLAWARNGKPPTDKSAGGSLHIVDRQGG